MAELNQAHSSDQSLENSDDLMNPDHLRYLKDRGVDARSLGQVYRSDGDDLLIYYSDSSGKSYKDSKGEAFVVRRPFPTGKPKFKAPLASGSRPYFSPLMPLEALQDVKVPLVLIEGPVKVDACWTAIPKGYCFVGLTGVWNIKDRRGADGIWREKNETRILPELKDIPMKGRQVIILFDSDIADNLSVDAAAKEIANWARRSGAQPHRVTLPAEDDGQKNGADDYIVRYGRDAILECIEQAEVEGWPLPASLLTDNGDLKPSYSPAEQGRIKRHLSQIQDIQIVDATVRALSTKIRTPYSELLAGIDDERAGCTESGFLGDGSDLDSDDTLDSSWIIPYILPKGETIVITGDPGAGKSLLCYSMAYAMATATPFLGLPVGKGVPLILQMEEGGTFGRRMKAIGFAKSVSSDGLELNREWLYSTTFDLAKPRHVEYFKLLIRNQADLVIVDSARAVARSLSVDENHADFGKRVIRRIAKMINDCGKAGVIIHHNNSSGKASGTRDIPAGVWGMFNLKVDELQPGQKTLETEKLREGEPIKWQLKLESANGADGSPDGWTWSLESDLGHLSPDLKFRDRFHNLLRQQDRPITLREAGDIMGLSEKEFQSFRVSISRDRACRRWAVGDVNNGQATRYFMDHSLRTQPPIVSAPCKPQEEKSQPRRKEGSQGGDTHPIYEEPEKLQVQSGPKVQLKLDL